MSVKDISAECGDDGAIETSGQGYPDAFIRREEPGVDGFGESAANIVVIRWHLCARRWLVAPRSCVPGRYVKRRDHPSSDEIRL